MIAYKYRSLDQFEFILDILINNRLFCSEWQELNDPMEGRFNLYWSTSHDDALKVVERLTAGKTKRRICALSEKNDTTLLWAHYAGGFSGVAIELELPDNNESIKMVGYRETPYYETLTLDKLEDFNEDESVNAILFSKHEVWRYEGEIRILHPDKYFEVPPIKKIYLGPRMKPNWVSAFTLICEALNIEIYQVEISSNGLSYVKLPPFNSNNT